jgi:NAD(P)-dependent dehydrogenase (short-subunit alcohol dehydrogenase family)
MTTTPERKVALVTGGARGIGLATARALAADGWRVALADRDAAALPAAAAEVGADTLTVPLDVADVPAVRAALAQLVRDAGRLDCLVNNAGIFKNEPLLEVEEETYDRLMSVNLRGAFFVLQAAARAMREAGNGGVIVNVSSSAGRSGRPTQAVYGMTKAALIHLTKSAAMALAPDIRVLAVCPTAVETEMWSQVLAERRAVGGDADISALFARIPLGRACTADEIAGVIAFLASGKAAYMTGSAIDVSGGMEMG